MRHKTGQSDLVEPDPNAKTLDQWDLARLTRDLTPLELEIDRLARIADLSCAQPELMNLNPIEFANSFRYSDLHFLLANKLTRLN